jgi:hypothetical protein
VQLTSFDLAASKDAANGAAGLAIITGPAALPGPDVASPAAGAANALPLDGRQLAPVANGVPSLSHLAVGEHGRGKVLQARQQAAGRSARDACSRTILNCQ